LSADSAEHPGRRHLLPPVTALILTCVAAFYLLHNDNLLRPSGTIYSTGRMLIRATIKTITGERRRSVAGFPNSYTAMTIPSFSLLVAYRNHQVARDPPPCYGADLTCDFSALRVPALTPGVANPQPNPHSCDYQLFFRAQILSFTASCPDVLSGAASPSHEQDHHSSLSLKIPFYLTRSQDPAHGA